MAVFVINTAIETTTPTIEVTVSPDRPLPLGRHRFRLIVVDDSGNRSAPDDVEMIVADQGAPTAVLGVPRIAPFGTSFNLDGSRSVDVGGGRVVQFVWTYLGPTTIG